MRLIVTLFLLGQTGLGTGYPWDQDMVDQPSPKPQESPAPSAPGSVPIVGGETMAMPAQTTTAAMDEAKDAAAVVPNPVEATPESIARGKYFYEMTCTVCHGPQGTGDGPVGSKFITKAPVDLNDEYTQDQADGQLFFTITRGRSLCRITATHWA